MQDEYQAREGYLLLADISGYTKFLTGTELEHAQAIIHELTTLVRDRLVPPMQFVKVEGDAVDLAGPDVILVHRLLKNTVSESIGVTAYALLTDACLQQLPPTVELPRHEEYYESFGVTRCGVHDLKPVIAAMRDARRLYVGADDADLVLTFEVPIPPAAAWKYWVDPVERQRWVCRFFSKKPDRVTRNAHGRTGSGTAMHCNHGPGTWRWEFVDWRPFSYFTCDVSGPRGAQYLGPRDQFSTFECVSTPDGGTQVVQRIRLKKRGMLSLLTYRVQRHGIAAFWRKANSVLLSVIAEDAAVS